MLVNVLSTSVERLTPFVCMYFLKREDVSFIEQVCVTVQVPRV